MPQERIQLLKGANREQMQRAVERASAERTGDGVLWVYFSGHAATSPEGRPLLVGDDAKPDPTVFTERAVAMDDLALPPGAVLWVDASLGGTDWDGQPLVPGARFAVPSYARASGATVWTASEEAPATFYASADHGLFTWLLVGGLRGWADGIADGDPDGQVTLREVAEYVERGSRQLHAGSAPGVPTDAELVLTSGTLEPGPDLATLPDVNGRVPQAVPSAPPTQAPIGLGGTSAMVPRAAGSPVGRVSFVGAGRYQDEQGNVFALLELQRASGDPDAFETARIRSNSGAGTLYVFGTAAVITGFATTLAGALVGSVEEDSNSTPIVVGGLAGMGLGIGLFTISVPVQRGHKRRMAEEYNEGVQ